MTKHYASILGVVLAASAALLLVTQAGTMRRPGGVRDETIAADGIAQVAQVAPHPLKEYAQISEGPARLRIPAIGVDASIEHVGLNKKGEMGIPNDFDNVAWFTEGAKPGERGNAVIAGHVNDRWNRDAVFTDLEDLAPGDRIEIAYADGSTFVFQVVKKEIYDARNAPVNEIFGASRESRLNLITCAGVWLRDIKQYDKRLVVYAELIET